MKTIRNLSIAIFISLIAAPLLAQKTGLESINAHDLKTHMLFLASDELEGRNTGEPGMNIAARYLAVQAARPDSGVLERVERLLQHPDFDLRNPNKVRSLVGTFAGQNPVNFHRADGAGYRFLTDVVIELDAMNPQIAARLLAPLTKWRNYRGRAELMKAELERLAGQGDLSPDVFEVVTKSLG